MCIIYLIFMLKNGMSLNSDIEGNLFKWTNYWGGWQPRWVVLHNGILSYYNNPDEVSKGCRASIKISASDIVAYPSDNQRFDVVVPNEQRWYLKASNPGERQAWIIALGTSKANDRQDEFRQKSTADSSVEELRRSMNEVRLFCDVLVQQTLKLKEETTKEKPDPNVLSDSSLLLSTTCDTFLASLDHCSSLSETRIGLTVAPSPILRSHSHDGQLALPQLNKTKLKKRQSRSAGHTSPATSSLPVIDDKHDRDDPFPPMCDVISSDASSLSSVNTDTTMKSGLLLQVKVGLDSPNVAVDADEDTMLTFFSAMLHSFSDVVLHEDGGIPTLPFLSACEGILPFLDTIGSTAFSPVRMDFMGNISKLKTKLSADVNKFKTLQGILQQEIQSSTTRVRNSATDALMWLKRGLRFMQKFLVLFKDGERDITVALNQAYSVTLKPYHGWVVKGIFALAVKSAPYPGDFIRALATNPDHVQDKRFLSVLLRDIEQYTTAMEVLLNIIDNFYENNKLESTALV